MESLLFPALFLLAAWFLLIRPQQQRVRQQRELIASLAVGDEIVTAGGLVGTVRVLTDQEARVEVGPGIEVRIVRGAVSRILAKADAGPVEDDEPGSPEPT
jgi:preprotein translocase subunit YajC